MFRAQEKNNRCCKPIVIKYPKLMKLMLRSLYCMYEHFVPIQTDKQAKKS